MPELKNLRHERFAQLVAQGSSQKAAHENAGFTRAKDHAKAGCHLAKLPQIKERIAEIIAMRDRIYREAQDSAAKKVAEAIGGRLGLSREWVLEQLIDNVNIAKSLKQVTDSEGKPIGEFKVDLPAANKALELIGKELGMFIERKMQVKSPFDELGVTEQQQVLAIIKDMSRVERDATTVLLEHTARELVDG